MRIWGDERAVSPLVGYVLAFGITSGFLVTVLLSSTTIIQRRHEAAAEIMFDDLAHRIANSIEEALYVVDENPDADYEKRLPLPEDVRGLSYKVEVTDTAAYVNASNGVVETQTVIHNAEDRSVSGSVQRRASARIVYDPGTEAITLEGGT